MAQQRLRDYQDALGSFQHNLINLGIHKPGRFAGFSKFVPTGGLSFRIEHDTGINYMDQQGLPVGPVGVIMTNQGLIVVEDAPVNLNLVSNAGNPTIRIDLLVCTHQSLLVTGGVDAIYEVIQGPFNSVTPPSITPYQTILGSIQMVGGASDSSSNGTFWFKSDPPDSGDMIDAHLESRNIFKHLQEFKQSDPITVTPQGVTDLNALNGTPGKRWTPQTFGNTILILPTTNTDMDLLRLDGSSMQDGIEINVFTNERLILKHNTPPSPAEIAANFANIIIDDKYRLPNNTYQGTQSGARIIYNFLKVQKSWYLKGISGVGYIQAAVADTTPKILLADVVQIGDVPPGGNATYTIDVSALGFTDPKQYGIIGWFAPQITGQQFSDTVAWSVAQRTVNMVQINIGEFAGVLQALQFFYYIISHPTPH